MNTRDVIATIGVAVCIAMVLGYWGHACRRYNESSERFQAATRTEELKLEAKRLGVMQACIEAKGDPLHCREASGVGVRQ